MDWGFALSVRFLILHILRQLCCKTEKFRATHCYDSNWQQTRLAPNNQN